MSDIPPSFANYPRSNGSLHGSATQLQNLYEGYNGLNQVFFVNIVLAAGARAIGTTPRSEDEARAVTGIIVLVTGLLIGFLSYPQNKKIGFGAGWPPSRAILASVLMGLNSALCCGIVGFIVMQTIAMNHIKKYGLKSGFFGLKKQEVQWKVDELKTAEANGRV